MSASGLAADVADNTFVVRAPRPGFPYAMTWWSPIGPIKTIRLPG
jgi:hypothetical protein